VSDRVLDQHGPSPRFDKAIGGLAGRFLALVEPHTEASCQALLIQFLVSFGNMCG
jgi:hypothetical protein